MESHIEKKEKKIPEKNDKKDNLHPNNDQQNQQNHQKHKKEKKRREYKVFYSDYGYIKIDKKDLDKLFTTLTKYKVSFYRSEKYTLEKHFKLVMKEKEKENNVQ